MHVRGDGKARLIDVSTGLTGAVSCWVEWNNGVPNRAGQKLSLHGELLYYYLLQGSVLADAVDAANWTYPPRNGAGNSLPMQVRGDGKARLMNVYTGATSSPGWYKVVSPA